MEKEKKQSTEEPKHEHKPTGENEDVNISTDMIEILEQLYNANVKLKSSEDETNRNTMILNWNNAISQARKEDISNENILEQYFCFYHLKFTLKWHIGCATKFGGHYLLYKRQNVKGSKKIHSSFMVLYAPHVSNLNNVSRIFGFARLCHSVKKQLVIANFTHENNIMMAQFCSKYFREQEKSGGDNMSTIIDVKSKLAVEFATEFIQLADKLSLQTMLVSNVL